MSISSAYRKSVLERAAWATTLAIATAAAGAAAAAPAAPPSESAPGSSDETTEKARALAKERFERGLGLMKQSLWDDALTEFLASRAIFASRGNTQNAGVCLRELGRNDEALELFESLLAESAQLKEADRASITQEIAGLRAKVGNLEVLTLEPDATVLVDGRPRGKTPLLAPIRVSAGQHVVRILKQGFSLFEARIQIEPRKTTSVEGLLNPLTSSGILRVAAVGGQVAEVLVDGVLVGKTPWQGAVAVGPHSVSLRGEGQLGTAPVSAKVIEKKTTPITLELVELSAELRVQPVPINAVVAIDGVEVGGGIWDGRLPSGEHRLEAAAEGFQPLRHSVKLESGGREVVKLQLERDPDSELWADRAPARFILDLLLTANIAPLVGGDLADSCTGSCSGGLGLGGLALLRGGYQFGMGIGLSVDAGYAVWHQAYEGRPATLTPRGLAANTGTADDELLTQGLLVGASASYQVGEDWPFQLRIGGGVFFGSTRDERSGTFTTNANPMSYQVGPVTESHATTYAFVSPELRIGYRVAESVILSLAAQGVFLFAVSAPEWGDEQTLLAGQCDGTAASNCEGEATFGPQKLSGSPIILVTPGLALKVEL